MTDKPSLHVLASFNSLFCLSSLQTLQATVYSENDKLTQPVQQLCHSVGDIVEQLAVAELGSSL